MLRGAIGAARLASYGVRAVKRTPVRFASTETDEWFIFPREEEGNIYMHNWSMVEDGVVPVGKAFRNARLPVIANAMGAKASDTTISASKPSYAGKFAMKESGDNMSHEEFSQLLSAQQQYLSASANLFVEDAALGVNASVRQGARIICDDPAVALIARNLLAQSPAKPLDHRARFKGWNLDPRWKLEPQWKDGQYFFPEDMPAEALPGDRPIVAFVGGPGEEVAVQFVENNDEIVGANIVVGGSAPVQGIVAAMGHAASVVINELCPSALALPSVCVGKGASTVLIIGADDTVVSQAAAAGMLFGAYHNILTADGVSAMWNGYIADSGATSAASTPLVEVNGKSAVTLSPNNLAYFPSSVVFYEAGAKKSKLSADEAVKRIGQLTDESKEAVAMELLKNVSISIAGSPKDINSLL